MAPHIDRILALLPFEPAALERLHGPKTIYVGHPLIERLAELRPDAAEAAARADAANPVVLVLPGSRRSEINHLMPVFGEAVALVSAAVPGRALRAAGGATSSRGVTGGCVALAGPARDRRRARPPSSPPSAAPARRSPRRER